MRSLSLQAQVTITIVVSLVLIDVIGAAVAEQHFRALEQRNVSEDAKTGAAAMKHVVDLRFGAMGLRAREAVEAAGYGDPDQVMREMMRAGFSAVVVLGTNNTVLSAGGDAMANHTLRALLVSRAPPQNYPAQMLRYGDGWLTIAARSTGVKHAVVGAMSQSYVETSFLGDVLIHPTDANLIVLRDGTILASSTFDGKLTFSDDDVPRYATNSSSIVPTFFSGALGPESGSGETYVLESVALEVMDGRVVRLVPGSAIDARVSEMALRFFLVSTASYILVGVVVLFSIAYAMRPLKNITEAARRLGRGEEDLRLHVRSRDELGLLAQVMAQSAAAIGEARRRQEMHAEESRLAAEAFQVAVGGLARAVAEAETHHDIASRLADAILHVTPARAVAISHEGRVLGAASSEGGRHDVEALLASASDAFHHARMGSGDDVVDIAILPQDGAGLVPTDQRKVEILGTQAVFAFHRARATASLRSAHQAMDQLVQQKQMFLDILSHDLKNPLTVARGRLELLARRDPEIAAKAAPIEASLDRAASLIDEAVLYSRLERDAKIERPSTDLVALVQDAAGAIRPLAAQKGVTIAVQAPEIARWPANSLVGRAVENLVSNAVKWSPKDAPVEIVVATRGGLATIRVQDHGPGIPEEDRKRLFARFQRVDRSGVKGTGLGLAIAKRVVDMHEGDISIEETPGGGATFVITLPLNPESRSSCPPQAGIGGAQ